MNKGTYEAALREARKKSANLGKAFQLLMRSHKAGDARATYALATWYLFGKEPVVKKNLKQGVMLLTSAATSENRDALHDLAVCFAKGAGVRRSDSRAAQLYLAAALRGDAQSAYEVGRCYWHGTGVTKDRRIARVWLDFAEKFEIEK